VLSQELREELYRQVADRGADITSVSAAFGVSIQRVAAVVRLMSVEKKWIEEVSAQSPHFSTSATFT
jgi:transposase-like protein